MKISSNLVEIFQASINEYHIKDSVDQSFENKLHYLKAHLIAQLFWPCLGHIAPD